ncbi:hypothetical protein HDU92_004831 [Lobulomyces angularis]|nr:hypothetical protein HDU92_004831 [Lobulomyces angularis]
MSIYLLVWVTAASTFYYVIHLEKVPYSNRTRFIDISDTVENYLGSRSFNQIISTFNGKFLPYDHPYTEVVRHVASQIISVAPMRGDIKWEVFVINSPEINAFVIPGGKIFVFTGILPICRDADGLAAVLGHEIGHEVARHISEKLSFQKVILFFELLLSMFIDPRVVFNSGFLELAILNPFSRKMESEADYIGLRLCKEAGFSVYATVEMWERMKRADKSQSGKMREFLSTHPNCDSRIKDLKKWINELGY